jgi:hypothetical protein
MPDRRSLPLRQRNAVVARLLIFDVLYAYRAEFDVQEEIEVWAEVHNKLITRTARAIKYGPDGQSLEDFLHHLLGELQSDLPSVDNDEISSTLSYMFEEIKHKVHGFAAQPSDPLLALFDCILDATVDFYRSSGLKIHQHFCNDVSFEIGFTTADRRPFPARHLVEASTDFYHRSIPSSKVHLELVCIDRFDWPTALVIPYVLFHECVSHVAQGPWAVKRESPGGFSSYADGWMDLIAYQIHVAAMERRASASSPLDAYPPRSLGEAAKLHEARYDRQEGDRTWSRRSIGRDGAEELLKRVYRLLPETRDDPEKQLWRLSMDLNISDIPHGDRDLFAKRIEQAMRRETLRAQVTQLIKDYVQDHDVRRLVGSVLKLPSPGIA